MKIKDFIGKADSNTLIKLYDISCGAELEIRVGQLMDEKENTPDWLVVAAPLLLESKIDSWNVDGIGTVNVVITHGEEAVGIGETQETATPDI